MVVAGAVLATSDDRILLAQRRYPPEVAGLWELPGGKVEDGEDLAAALRRELLEELDVLVEPGVRLEVQVPLSADLTLIAMWARIVGGTVRPLDHAAVAWVDAARLRRLAELGQIVPADTAWLPEILAVLEGT